MAADSYDNAAQLQREVGRHLLRRIAAQGMSGRVLDLGCGTGFLTEGLAGQAGVHSRIALDLALPMLEQARYKLGNPLGLHYLCADAASLPFADASLDGVVSNLALQWCGALDTVLEGIWRALRPGGQLAFSTFGEGTLQELKQAWAAVDDHQHVNLFHGQQQLLSSVQAAGFAGIEVCSDRFMPAYGSVMALLNELKQLGAGTVVTGRRPNLTGKRRLQAMTNAYPVPSGGQVHASFHVITITANR